MGSLEDPILDSEDSQKKSARSWRSYDNVGSGTEKVRSRRKEQRSSSSRPLHGQKFRISVPSKELLQDLEKSKIKLPPSPSARLHKKKSYSGGYSLGSRDRIHKTSSSLLDILNTYNTI